MNMMNNILINKIVFPHKLKCVRIRTLFNNNSTNIHICSRLGIGLESMA